GWQMQAKATRFDPGAFAAAWPGSLDFALSSGGTRTDTGTEATLLLDKLAGKLRNRAVAGDADLKLSDDSTVSGALEVRSGRSRVHLQGSGSREANSVAATIDASLDDWLPDASGSLDAEVRADGRWPELKITGNARGSELRIGAERVGKLALEFDITKPLHPDGTLTLELQDATAAGFAFAQAKLGTRGNEGSHTVQLTARGEPLSIELALQGALKDGEWQGELQSLTFDAKDVARLTLQQPVRIAYSDQASTVSEACFADRGLRLCFEGERRADRTLRAQYSLREVPLALVHSVLAPALPLSVQGTLQGEGDIRRDAQGLLSGKAALQSARGAIAQKPLDTSDQPRVLLEWSDLALQATLAGANASATLRSKLNEAGSLQGQLSASGFDTPSTQLQGAFTANLPSIAVVEMFAPQLANVQGQLALRADITGTLDAPQISGELTATELAMELPDIGLKLRDGNLSVTPQGGVDGPLRVTGAISSGKGKLEIDGTGTLQGTARLTIKGDDFLAADMPGVRVHISPNLDFERGAERMTLVGDLRLQGADINLQKLPRGNRAQAASADVVVVDETSEMQKEAQSIPLLATINVDLGENVKLAGYGLDATVTGKLNVRERPGEPTTGSGEIRVAGTYKAYGQDLTIRQGQLLYAQTPLDNPRLNIVAVRVIDTVTAGLRVGGSAQSPQLSVFSDPAMGQSSALSYLVAGKPLDSIGEGEGDALQSAARSLGTAAGGLLAKNLGRRLGVDELGIKDSASLGGAALTVGQYLSPRLYLSYGVGLFTPGEVITLRYKLTRDLALEAENSAQKSRAGVQYRLER
ncbi:MAG: translocation/assembly module TamB domain-containing protein, partial [Steroidobacteraceae bacterium]